MRQLSLRMCKKAHEIEINTPACPQGQEKSIEIRNYHFFKKTAKTSDEKNPQKLQNHRRTLSPSKSVHQLLIKLQYFCK